MQKERWQGVWERRVRRRALLKGAVLGGLGLAAAAIVGCASAPSKRGGVEATSAPLGEFFNGGFTPSPFSGAENDLSSLATAPEEAFEALPPDLPLPALPPRGLEWTRGACVMQPWGQTQYVAMMAPRDLPERLAQRFGFNALAVLPVEAHNAITQPEHRLTAEEWERAIDAYRRAGYRTILYSGIVHCGHAPIWQTGELAKAHPEWSQRDPKGGVVALSGKGLWLCPNTGAFDYSLEYTIGLVQRYRPDAVMLDNNQFTVSKNGPTCYCDECQAKFREYVLRRFGSRTRAFFGTEEIRIPTERSLLYNLWIHWRNWVWASATRSFRRHLAEVAPGTLLFANTQYHYDNWHLASDNQYQFEDVVLSESRDLTSWEMSAKMRLGRALASDRPLWNYIGTFREDDYGYLRSPEKVRTLTTASLAGAANPWIVYYGFDRNDEKNEPARKVLRELLSFRARFPFLYQDLKAWTPVGTLFSTLSRNYHGTPILPSHVRPLQQAGVPLRGICDVSFSPDRLATLRLLVAEHVTCLADEQASLLAEWVVAGGTLVATPDLGRFDPIGRQRPGSIVVQRLGMRTLEPGALGRGRMIVVERAVELPDIVKQEARAWRFVAPGWEVLPYLSRAGEVVLHLLNHEAPQRSAWELRLPAAITGRSALLFVPGTEGPQSVRVESGLATLPPIGTYGVMLLNGIG